MNMGICLIGGGARGAFQAGVLKCLRENNLTDFKAMSGTSIGSINGYVVFTGNWDRLESMWKEDTKKAPAYHKIVNKTIDNTSIMESLRAIEDMSPNKIPFYVNYVDIVDGEVIEVIKDLSRVDKDEAIEAVRYSSLLPAIKMTKPTLRETFEEVAKTHEFDGYSLDGGIVRSDLIEPLLDEDLDLIIVSVFAQDYKLPAYMDEFAKNKKVIVIKPDFDFDPKDGLNFDSQFCSEMFDRGYEITKKHIDEIKNYKL